MLKLSFTVSWMLKVTRGPGDEASILISGKSSTSPILELQTHGNAKWHEIQKDKHVKF